MVFLRGLQAGFLSDAFVFIESTRNLSFSSILARFIPSGESWYRPATEFAFWLEYQTFGSAPLGYHVVALLCHIASSILLYFVALHLTRHRVASGVAAYVFLLTIHAHEVVWDVADLHNALGGVGLLATILLFMKGSYALAFPVAALTLTIDETGLLILPIVGLHELLFRVRKLSKHNAATAFFHILPFVALTIGYVLFRLVLVPTGFFNETVPCHTIRCIAIGGLEYINRLFVRTEHLMGLIWDHRPMFAIAILLSVALLILLLRPWKWRNWRAIGFAGGWLVGSVLYYILALWPYVADRFLYIPDMGLALLIGTASAEVMNQWNWPGANPTSTPWRASAVSVAAIAVLWVGAGIPMLWSRGELWDKAGKQAEAVIERTYALVPNPPPNATFLISNVPDSYSPAIPPGNTGPYLFRNGLDSALRMRYNRSDISMVRDFNQGSQTRSPGVILLTIDNGEVMLVGTPK